MINVHIVPILKDNYAYILEAPNGEIGVVDPGEAAPVIAFLEKNNFKPSVIFNTHHHGDHIAGNDEIKNKYGTKIIGPEKEKRIDSDFGVSEGSILSFGGEDLKVMEIPGHTTGHICFYFPTSEIAFVGDTLFSLGCGRVIEGSMEQMWDSLQKIAALPGETLLYCGHEYTLSNGRFGLSVEPGNQNLQRRMIKAEQLQHQKIPTLPVSLASEKQTNVFLRAGSAERFAELRRLKDKA